MEAEVVVFLVLFQSSAVPSKLILKGCSGSKGLSPIVKSDAGSEAIERS